MQHTAQSSRPLNTAGFAHPSRNVGAFDVQQGMVVADFGSGSGAYALAIAERLGNTGYVYAVDVQRDLLRRTQTEAKKRGYTNVGIVWSDLERSHGSNFADRSLDLVLVSNLLFQLDDKAAILAEAWRVLKPAGRLVLIDWTDSFGGMGPVKKDVVKKEQALKLANDAHFELVREFEAGAHHYGLILRPTPKSL